MTFAVRFGGAAPSESLAWDAATDRQREAARTRLSAARRSDELAASGTPRALADAAAAREIASSASSVAAWRRRIRGLPPESQAAALLDAPKSGRPGPPPEAVELMAALALEHGRHVTAEHVRRAMRVRGLAVPSARTAARWLGRWRMENARAISAVEHPDRHRSLRKPAAGDAAAVVTALNGLWELDSTPADVMCDPGGRQAVVAAVDVWSRRAKVLVAPVSRSAAIAALLRRCVLDWGVPACARTDEGADYTSRHLAEVLRDLGVAHDRCPPYAPESKPFVERFIGTLSRDLFAFLPGFTGHSVADAQAIRNRKSFAARMGGADPWGVSLSPEDLQRRCDAWTDSVYGRRPHSGLDGDSPWARANAWTRPVRRVRDERALDVLLGDGDARTVGKKGLRIDGGLYVAAELGDLVGEKVRFRRDPADLGRVLVYRGAAFLCVAEDPARTGVDRAAIAARMKARAREADREARGWARDLKKRISPETVMDEALEAADAEAGRVVDLPRRDEACETPALREAARAAARSAEVKSLPPPKARRVVDALKELQRREEHNG